MVYFKIYHYGKISTLKLRDISLGASQCHVFLVVVVFLQAWLVLVSLIEDRYGMRVPAAVQWWSKCPTPDPPLLTVNDRALDR